jgi:hypothetical protein
VIAAMASEDSKKPISWDKAKEVLGSVGFTGQASNYVTVGKPGFDELAIENAREIAEKGERLLLLRVDVLGGLCLKIFEGKIVAKDLLEFLETRQGYVSRQGTDA